MIYNNTVSDIESSVIIIIMERNIAVDTAEVTKKIV